LEHDLGVNAPAGGGGGDGTLKVADENSKILAVEPPWMLSALSERAL